MALDETIIGKRNGRLVVTKVIGVKNGKTRIMVLCDCGKSKEMTRGNFGSSGPKSCGCLNTENILKIKKTWRF